MRMARHLLSAVAAFFILGISFFPVPASGQVISEDFLTTQYRDTLTTAWWDTTAGELKLYPFQPSIFGSYNTSGTAYDVTIAGDNMFIADGASGLVILDITDPSSPSLLGSYNTAGTAEAVAVSGNYAYVADGASGLVILDISDIPGPPTLAAALAITGSVSGVTVDGNHAFIVGGVDSLIVIDISDPENPVAVGSSYTMGSALDVAVNGDYACVAAGLSGLIVFDISDPANPAPVGIRGTGGEARSIDVDGDLAVLANGTYGTALIDISDPSSPGTPVTVPLGGETNDARIDGDMVYVANSSTGLTIIDITDPGIPSLVEDFSTPGTAFGVCFAGVHAFIADGSSGIQVIEMRTSIPPVLWGSYPASTTAWKSKAAGDYLFIAGGSDGLVVVDISDPSAPTLAGGVTTDGEPMDIDIAGDHAFIADGYSGLAVIDISDPESPVYLADYPTWNNPVGIEVVGNYAYLACGEDGLYILDISDPEYPGLAGQYDNGAFDAYDVDVDGDYAYVAAGEWGMVVIDVSDPANPAYAGEEGSGTLTFDALEVHGDHVITAGSFGSVFFGIYPFVVTDPTMPALAGNAAYLSGPPGDLVLAGDYIYVTYNDDSGPYYGLEALFMDEYYTMSPVSPIDNYSAGDYAHRGVTLAGDYLYLTGEFGLQVLRVFSRDLMARQNVAQSVSLGLDKAALKLSATQTDSIQWFLYDYDFYQATGEVALDEWISLRAYPSRGYGWRAVLFPDPDGGVPVCTGLEIEYLLLSARIDSIVDIPGDQGGWARIHFTRSGLDFSGDAERTEEYTIWRRIDGLAAPAAPSADDYAARFPSLPITRDSGRFVLDAGAPGAPDGFPPGEWEIIGNFPAFAQHEYIYATPTLADSSAAGPAHSVYLITAHYRSDFWISPPDSGYSVDNIAPGVPLGLAVAYNTGSGNELTWDPSPETDFQYYRIYKSDSEDFVPGPGNLAHETATPAWTDPGSTGSDIYYKVTALDYAGNESEAASASTTTGDDTPEVPGSFALYQNAPNPFNPSTTIRFDLPGAVHVKLGIYNIKGELISTLVDGQMTAGRKEVAWTATDNRGRSVASGVYFYRIIAGGFEETRKMILLR